MSDHSHDDFAVEPIPGLPEAPPSGEVILWQGRPNWFALARQSLCLDWVAGYFVLCAAWRSTALSAEMPVAEAIRAGSPYLIMGIVACAILMAMAYAQARTTVYTLTNRRVAMRIGAALTMTLNLPYREIVEASAAVGRRGTGTIALKLKSSARLSYFNTWPHVRPWTVTRCEPALRAIPDAARVAQTLADAAEARVAEPQVTRAAPSFAIAAE